MQNKKHYFIIVNYNSGTNIIECINSILRSKKIHPYIIVVDNASKDNSLENCKKHFPNLIYIYNTHNIGFAGGVNIGLRFALEREAATITLCNPDAIIDSECATKLISTILTKKADIISPVIYKYNSPDIWFAGGDISYKKMRATHTHIKNDFQNQSILTTDYNTGCVMTINPRVFKQIDLFDEKFFLYYEDADFSLRAKNAGFILGILPTAKAWHKEVSEQENKQKTYFLVFSGLLFFEKHTTGLKKIWFLINLKLRKIKNYFDLKKNKPLSQQVHKAYLDYASKK